MISPYTHKRPNFATRSDQNWPEQAYFPEQNGERVKPFEESTYYRIFRILLLAWFCAYMYPIVSVTSILSTIKTANDSVQQGSLYNQLLVAVYALLGLINLPKALRLLNTRRAKQVFSLLGLYLAWSLVTFAWSPSPSLSSRRFVILIFLLIGSVGLGAGFYGRTRDGITVLAGHVICAASICGMWLVLRLSTGFPNITSPEWTMKYSFQIEPYAYALGYGMVAAIFLFRDRPLKKTFFACFYLLLLLALKGRTLILGIFSAAALVYSRLSAVRLARVALMTVSCVSTGILVDLVTGGHLLVTAVTGSYDLIAPLLPFISIGDGLRNLTELSGRAPLWHLLLEHAAEHPFVGHGFGAFWTPDRFAEIYSAVRWHAVVAHNGFLDEILATGIIGLVLLLIFWGFAMTLAWRRGGSGYLVFAWLLLFLAFNTMLSIIQSYFQLPMFLSIIGLVLVLVQDSAERCDHCGVELLPAETDLGQLVFLHP